MAGSRKNNKRPPKGPARQGAVADAARPTRVEKSTGNRRCGSAVQGAVTQTATNQTAQTAQTTQGQVPAPARRRRGVLSADVLTHGNLFGLRDPDDIATRNRRAAAGTTTSGTRPARKATKPTKKGTGRGTVAAAAPIAQAPQPAAPQPAHQSPLNNVEPEADVQPADNEPAPADEAVPKDIAAEQEAEREASEVQGAIRQAAAAKDRAAKQRVEKEEADKKKREADEKKKAAKAKADREQAERDEAARVAREEADRKEAVEEAMRKQAAQEQAKRDEAARVVKAEADRKQAAQEQAERVEAVRVAQGEADRKQAEEAARAQAVREKAAEEKRAAEEKEAAEKKQKAAQEAACQKAAQEATKAKADKEKAAAEAKAVQEKEQAAKARAAQDDAAAKTKAAAQKKAADDVAAFKKAEEEAKVEKLHQAKDQKEREKQELLEKEARGLKRPGVKRAAPPIEDQANKKAKTDDCKPSCERFENDLLHAKFIFGNQIARTPDGPVKFGSHLNLDIIFQALASVTEAINDAYAHYEKDKPDEQARRDQQGNPNMLTQDAVDKLWGLFHPRSLVDHNIVEHPVVLPRHEALVPINRSAGRKTLLSLVVLVQTEVGSRHGRELFAMHHYDCDPSLRAAFHNTFARQTVRSQIVKSGWTASRKGEIENPLGQSENRDCCDRLPGPDQEWTTGIHAILNGWVCAFKLKHNKNALLSNEGFYEKAVDLVNLAIRGHVRSRMILDFFDCYEYVEKDDLPEDQRQRRTFTGTKDFETYPRLHKEILRLLGRKLAVDIDDIMTPRTGPTETTEKPLGSGRRTGDYPPSNLDAFFRGTDGREELPKGKADAAKPKEGSVVDDGYDSARSDNDDDDDDEHDKDDEIDDEEDEAVEAPKIRFDFRGKVMTPEAIAAEKAANAAAKEKKEREKREREEREAPAREAADRVNAVEHDDTEDNSLFEDDDEDMNEFYNNNEPSQRDRPAPTSAPRDEVAQDDPEEDLYTSSISPRRQTQPRPSLQPTAVDGEDEDLYTSSPPRNRGPPPIAPASNLHLPGAPPPTPHDPYAAQPFLFPTMYPPVPPAPPVAKQSFNLVSEKGPVLPPPVLPPTSGRNPGFSVPPLSLSPKVKSKSPPKVVTTDSRQSTNPNPHGTSRVPDTLTDSSEYHDENTRAEPNGSAQANAPQEETTQPPAPQPTEADLEEEAFEMSRRGAYRLSPGLEAAMEAYDDNEDYDDQDEDPNDYQGERLPYTGDCYLEPDAGVKVRHRKKDDVQYGDVEVEVDENAEDEDEIDFAYDDDDDVDESGLY